MPEKREFRVIELGVYGPFSHGYVGPDKSKAMKDLNHKKSFYGKYGREFILESRVVTDWTKYA